MYLYVRTNSEDRTLRYAVVEITKVLVEKVEKTMSVFIEHPDVDGILITCQDVAFGCLSSDDTFDLHGVTTRIWDGDHKGKTFMSHKKYFHDVVPGEFLIIRIDGVAWRAGAVETRPLVTQEDLKLILLHD